MEGCFLVLPTEICGKRHKYSDLTLVFFLAISAFFCRHKESDKKLKSQDQDSERRNFLLSDQKELTVKDSVEVIFSLTYFPQRFTGKKRHCQEESYLYFFRFLIFFSLYQAHKMYVCNQQKCGATFMRRLPTNLFQPQQHQILIIMIISMLCFCFNNCQSGIILNLKPSVFQDHIFLCLYFGNQVLFDVARHLGASKSETELQLSQMQLGIQGRPSEQSFGAQG